MHEIPSANGQVFQGIVNGAKKPNEKSNGSSGSSGGTGVSSNAKHLIMMLLEKNKDRRITIGQVMTHPWLQ